MIKKSEAEWRQQLSAEAFHVTREAGTEAPFTGEHYHRTERGDYLCVCCGALLFHSDTKFDAGCGWPSFWQQAENSAIERRIDRSYGMVRTEVRCSHCGAHLGHVFNDGPAPTGERYCINSVALDFKKG